MLFLSFEEYLGRFDDFMSIFYFIIIIIFFTILVVL